MIFLTEGRGFLFSEMDNDGDQDDLCRVCGEVCNAAVTTPCCDAKVRMDQDSIIGLNPVTGCESMTGSKSMTGSNSMTGLNAMMGPSSMRGSNLVKGPNYNKGLVSISSPPNLIRVRIR
jgi:hypothetical protein